MQIFKTQEFSYIARKAKVSNKELVKAAKEIMAGRIDAKLGAFLIKQRVSEGQGGRSNSQRAIVVVKEGKRIVFLDMFAKNEKENVTPHELRTLKKAAKIIAALPESKVADLISEKEWILIEETSEKKGVSE